MRRALLLVASALAIAACAHERKSAPTARPAPPPAIVATAKPVDVPAEPPSGSFTIKDGPGLDGVFPFDVRVLDDGRVLVATTGRGSYGVGLALLDEKQTAWKFLRRPDPNWASPIQIVALDPRFAFIADAYIGPNPSHRGGVRWDPSNDTWTELPPLEAITKDHLGGCSAIVLLDGRVLVVGGVKASQLAPTREARIWSKEKGYETVTEMDTGRFQPTLTRLADGRVLVAGGKTSGGRSGSIETAELFDPKTNKFQPAGVLATRRQGHTATLLPDGRVVVAGGSDGAKAPMADLEAWDPKENKWSVVNKLLERRTHHTATLLPDGRVIFIGGIAGSEDDLGYDSGYTRLTNGEAAVTAELWDPKTNRFSANIHLSVGRYGHVTVLLRDGRLLVIGGTLGTLAGKPEPMQIWEPAPKEQARVLTVDPLPSVFAPPNVVLPDGRVVAVGANEIWDPARNALAPLSRSSQGLTVAPRIALAAPIGEADIVAVDNEHAARFAGDQWREIAPATGGYSATRAFRGNADASTVTPLDRDHVLFVGGWKEPWRAEVYSAIDDKFFDAGPLVRRRLQHAATLLDDGRVLLTGGQGERPPRPAGLSPMRANPPGPTLPSCELWDPKKKAFAATSAMREARQDHAAVRLADGRVLVTGGRKGDALRTAEIWSPKSSSWSSVAPMANARTAHTATLLRDGRVLVLGGDERSLPSTAEIYDPVQNAWSTVGPLPDLWWGHQATLLRDGRVLVTTKERSLVVSLSP